MEAKSEELELNAQWAERRVRVIERLLEKAKKEAIEARLLADKEKGRTA